SANCPRLRSCNRKRRPYAVITAQTWEQSTQALREQQREAKQREAESRMARGRARPHLMLLAIAALNTEPAAVSLQDLRRGHPSEAVSGVSEIAHPLVRPLP